MSPLLLRKRSSKRADARFVSSHDAPEDHLAADGGAQFGNQGLRLGGLEAKRANSDIRDPLRDIT